MKTIISLLGFVGVTYLNFWIFTNISYSQILFLLFRFIGISAIIGFFYFIFGNSKIINKASEYIEKKQIKENGRFLFSFLLGVFCLVLISEGTESYEEHVLSYASRETTAEISQCYKVYCVYSYNVNNKFYQRKFLNEKKYGFINKDKVVVIYYSDNPLISRIKE